MKRYLLSLLFSALAVLVFAVPAAKVSIFHTQSDGTVLSLTLVGDEHFHYYINNATGQAMRQDANGDYQTISEQELSAQTSAAAARRTVANQQRIARLPRMLTAQQAGGPQRAIGQTNSITGSKKGLVILVNFSDKAMQSSHNQSAFDAMFNQTGYNANGHIGSVHDYFKDQSYNQFDLTFDVVGPVTLSQNMAYYGGNDAYGNDLRPAQMAKDACNAVNSTVNFADYDWDGDSYVDQVFIIYAGYGENYGGADENTIWPHEWDLVSAGVGVLTVDGVKVKTYACAAELYGTSGTNLNGIGTAVHEFSHCLGYPDSYDTDYSGGVGMDSYDVMCGGSYNGTRGSVPAGYTAYQRWCAGWLTPTELNSAATITDMPALTDEAVAYIIKNSSNANEYFLLENRQSKSWFGYYDNNAAGHGLFVMHIDYNATAWNNNEPNDDPNHQRICWIPADGVFGTYDSSDKSWTISNNEHKGDFFPGTSNKTTLNGTSHSAVGGKWFNSENGSTTFSHEISAIAETNGKISFDFDGGWHDDGSRYTISLNAGAGTCATASWTQTEYQQSYTLPTPTIDIDGWTFAGWTTSAISAETSTAPSFKEATYRPTQDMTLYAVYKKTTQIGGDSKFYKNATLSALAVNTEYIFVAADGYALDASNLNSTANNSVAATAVTVSDGAISTTSNDLIWTCTYVAGAGVELKNGTNYLRIRSTGLSKTTSTSNDIKWNASKGLYYATSSNSYNIKYNSTAKTFSSETSVDSDTRIYAFVRNSQVTNVTVYCSNPQAEEPQPGDGEDEDLEDGEDDGEEIVITPISGIPAGYYNSTIVGKNNRTLELALKAIVNPHTHISYNSLWNAFKITDVVPAALLKNPAKTDQVYDMYADLNTFTKYYSDNDHSQTGGINREHCVPNSWWGGKPGNADAYSDLHHLVPSDGATNSAKSNHPLGEYKAGMTLSWPKETKTNTSGYTYVVADNTADHSGSWSHVWNTSTTAGSFGNATMVFEPADEFKGDFARMYLYVVCAYEGELTWQTTDNTMFSNGGNNYTVIADWAKALLLKWHRQDPVSDKERNRNNAVQSIQGNRNPFIDYPILAEYIWGDSIAKTSFSLETMPSAYQFAVTYCVGANVTCSERVSLCGRGSAITLPAATTVEGWTFSGWVTSPIVNTTTAPAGLLTGSYTPTKDIKLYAVFQAGDTYSISPEAIDTPDTPGTGDDDPADPSASALYFPHIAKLGQPFAEPAFTTNSDGAQTWTSSNTAVATVDNQGKVTIKAVGTTIITVTQAETATFEQASASYMIRVIE